MSAHRHKKGFTLLEITLSIGLLAILSVIALPVYRSFQLNTESANTSTIVAQSMRRASALSRAGQDDTTWGVNVQPGTVTVFRGASYATRDTTYDEDFDIPSNVSVSGLSEVVFDALTGNSASTGVLTLTDVNGGVKTVTVNENGMVEY